MILLSALSHNRQPRSLSHHLSERCALRMLIFFQADELRLADHAEGTKIDVDGAESELCVWMKM